MKIKTQFIVCILVFSVILIVIATSVAITQQQVTQLKVQEEISNNIERGASSLNSVSIEYFLYQEDLQLSRWQSVLSSLSGNLENLKPVNLQQQILENNVAGDLHNLNVLFDDVVSYLQSASRNVSVRIDPAFQLRWSSMAAQSQALAFDASQLSLLLDNQAHQSNNTTTLLIVLLVVAFGAFLTIIYLIFFRRTLKSITELQNGINTIGSGNLDYVIQTKRQDEIGELSYSFNKMTANLKEVTASKTDLEQAQDSLRESEQRWSTTLASIGDAVIATDVSGKITFMNYVAEELTGWTMSEASLKPIRNIFNIVNEQTRLEVEDPVSKVLEKGLIVGLANHTVLIKKDGSEIAIDDSGAPIVDKVGKISGVVLIFREITERRKAEEAIKRQASLIDLSPDAIIVWNHDGIITFWSEGAEKLYGWSKEEAVGQHIHELLETEYRQFQLKEIEDQLKLEGKWSGELIHTTKKGEKVAVQSFMLRKMGAHGQIAEIFESNIDVTDRNRMQTKLEESAIQLEEYANQMENLANQRAEQLKNAERLAAIGATAGMVGHDIRNPLQSIISDVYLAKTELAGIPESPEKQNAIENLQEIEKNIDYINKIVADLQDFARPLKPNLEEADLKKIITDLLAKNELPANVKVRVKVDDEVEKMFADAAYINRIMYNLVTNAVQAMPNGGKLTIYAFKDKTTNETVIAVTDTGVGIPESVKGKLFTPMFTTKSKGQGFGLAVIKRMAEALNGSVTFESEEGKGAKFIVRFPQKTQ
jgi:PAS domain S-box-containing protein